MKITLTPSLEKRKVILSNIREKNSSWKSRNAIAIVLMGVGVGILIGFAIMLTSHRISGFATFIIMMIGLVFSLIPFGFARIVKQGALFKCAYPYSGHANGILILDDTSLEYIFWKVTQGEPASNSSKSAVYQDKAKFVYRINRTDIQDIKFDENQICTITGNGVLNEPEFKNQYAKKDDMNYAVGISFIMAFEQDNAETLITEWRKNNVK